MQLMIPGKGTHVFRQVCVDYNGTLALDGFVPPHVMEALLHLNQKIPVIVLTADTYGTAAKAFQDTGIELHRFSTEKAGQAKKNFVVERGALETVAIGNGVNDIPMFQVSGLAIAVLGEEGCAAKLVGESDVLIRNIGDALALLEHPTRLKATLRL